MDASAGQAADWLRYRQGTEIAQGQVLKRKGLYRNGHSDRLAKLSSYVAYEAVLEEVSGRSAVVQV